MPRRLSTSVSAPCSTVCSMASTASSRRRNGRCSTKCSQDTALRDIDGLVQRGILVRDPAGGRSTSYSLAEFSSTSSLSPHGAKRDPVIHHDFPDFATLHPATLAHQGQVSYACLLAAWGNVVALLVVAR